MSEHCMWQLASTLRLLALEGTHFSEFSPIIRYHSSACTFDDPAPQNR